MERILAVDYGRRRIGLAVSDELGVTAQGLPTVEATGVGRAVAAVSEVASKLGVGEVVVGLPLNMDGTRGEMAHAAQAFAEALGEATGLPVQCRDERLTTRSAHRTMQEVGRKARGRLGEVDRIAATLLLEGHLEERRRQADGHGQT
jgi:putative Holliday junction resolvase